MKKLLIVLLSLTLLGCSAKKEETTFTGDSYKEIMSEKSYIIIDVRTKEEYEESHIKGSINIPYDEITKDSNIPKDKVVFVYCRSGVRSKKAYDTLKDLDYEVYDLGAFDKIDLEKE